MSEYRGPKQNKITQWWDFSLHTLVRLCSRYNSFAGVVSIMKQPQGAGNWVLQGFMMYFRNQKLFPITISYFGLVVSKKLTTVVFDPLYFLYYNN